METPKPFCSSPGVRGQQQIVTEAVLEHGHRMASPNVDASVNRPRWRGLQELLSAKLKGNRSTPNWRFGEAETFVHRLSQMSSLREWILLVQGSPFFGRREPGNPRPFVPPFGHGRGLVHHRALALRDAKVQYDRSL